jgi:hypothetical protein
MKKKRNFTRLNLYLDIELADAIKANARADYLKPTTWVSQYLRKSLLDKNNISTNNLNNEQE